MSARNLAAGALAALLGLICPVAAIALIVKPGNGTSVECSTTAAPLDDTTIPNDQPRVVVVTNPSSSAPVRIGGAGVTAATGTELRSPGTYSTMDCIGAGVQLYCITASGTATVSVTEYLGCPR